MELKCKYDYGQKNRPEVHRGPIEEPAVRRCENCLAPLCAWCGDKRNGWDYCDECLKEREWAIEAGRVDSAVEAYKPNAPHA